MSISGLSNHLYVVVTTIISLLVAPSTLHQPRAIPSSHDFTESRQFKKNFAVSKYRDNPHWMPNYTWKPPEKFYGPRKRPAWEVDKVAESSTNLKKQQELEEWEMKMRDVTNRQREKWKTYIVDEKSELETADEDLAPTDDPFSGTTFLLSEVTSDDPSSNNRPAQVFKADATKRQKEVQKIRTYGSDTWDTNLHNGRWGMSVATSNDEEFSTESSRSEKINPTTPSDQKTTWPAIISDGRWGMSVKKPPNEFLQELSRSQPRDISGRVWKQDEEPKSAANRKIHDGSEVRAKKVNAAAEGAATKLPKVFPSGRWGMSLDLPPRDFLREISNRDPPRIQRFYGAKAVHQGAHRTANNNSRLRGFVFSQVPGIPTILFLQSFPTIIEVPTFPRYYIADPRIWPTVPNYNIAVFSYIISQKEFP